MAPSPEITDEILVLDPQGQRLPVPKQPLLDAYAAIGDQAAVAIITKIPADCEGRLDVEAVDHLLLRVHREMQRLSEEFCHGARVLRRLRPELDRLRRMQVPQPWRVVDIGCGTGYVLRWLAACGRLPAEVVWIGCDLNPALIAEATRLATIEHLPVRFVCGDALRAVEPAAIYLSTGVLHHLRGQALAEFLAAQMARGPQALLHWDFQPGAVNLLGGWFFHALRARHPLVLHDGLASLRRMHRGPELCAAASEAGYTWEIRDSHMWGTPLRRVMHLLSRPPSGRDHRMMEPYRACCSAPSVLSAIQR